VGRSATGKTRLRTCHRRSPYGTNRVRAPTVRWGSSTDLPQTSPVEPQRPTLASQAPPPDPQTPPPAPQPPPLESQTSPVAPWNSPVEGKEGVESASITHCGARIRCVTIRV